MNKFLLMGLSFFIISFTMQIERIGAPIAPQNSLDGAATIGDIDFSGPLVEDEHSNLDIKNFYDENTKRINGLLDTVVKKRKRGAQDANQQVLEMIAKALEDNARGASQQFEEEKNNAVFVRKIQICNVVTAVMSLVASGVAIYMSN